MDSILDNIERVSILRNTYFKIENPRYLPQYKEWFNRNYKYFQYNNNKYGTKKTRICNAKIDWHDK